MLLPPQVKQHPFEYLALFILLIVSAFVFLLAYPDSHLQRRVVYFASAAYFGWSLYHHHHRGDLQVSIIIEYLLFALLAILLLSSTLF